jgi:hypothetical protein
MVSDCIGVVVDGCPAERLSEAVDISGVDLSLFNETVPFCRLPDEIIVVILKLIQGRVALEHVADRTIENPYQPYWRSIRASDAESLAWRHMMLVCARMRQVAMQNPEVWAFISTSWPERWVNLCFVRSGRSPLHMISYITDRANARWTAQLLPKARHAAVYVCRQGNPNMRPSEWWKMCRETLYVGSNPVLRVLKIQNITSTNERVAPSSHSVGGPQSMISTLKLERLELPEIPYLSCLEHLELQDISCWSHGQTWLHHWLAASPRLKSLSVASLTNILVDNTIPHPVSLSELAKFKIGSDLFSETPFRSLAAVLRIVPVPAKSLTVVMYMRHRTGDEANSPTLLTAAEDGVHEALMYTQRFWLQSGKNREPPPINIELDRQDYITWRRFIMPITPQAYEHLFVHIYTVNLAEMGPFLSLPAFCKLKLNTLAEFAVISPEINRLDKLERLKITLKTISSIADVTCIQTWTDARAHAGRSPVQVEIGQEGVR